MRGVVYLDDNASNPIDQRVLDAMLEVYSEGPANASSSHEAGRRAAARVEAAREAVAQLVGASPNEVVFTSGATEANNLLLGGLHLPRSGATALVSAGEHPSVAQAADQLQDRGVALVQTVGLTAGGAVDLDVFEAACSSRADLVSVVAANSETGVLNDLATIAAIGHRAGAVVHSDATQWIGRLPLQMRDLGLDALSLSGHKMCGPQGVGALVARRHVLKRVRPLAHGGGHERGYRSGSLNVAGIVGLGVAATLAANPDDSARQIILRDRLHELLLHVGDATINGDTKSRLPNTLNVRFAGAPADAVLARAVGVAASVGSACHAGTLEPSRILVAMGLTRQEASESIRFSITRQTTLAEIELAAERTRCAVTQVRQLNLGRQGDNT